MIPSISRAVHYVLPKESRHPGQHRAAIITQVWTANPGDLPTEETPVQLHVFADLSNDGFNPPGVFVVRNSTQDPYGKQFGSWHEPERANVPPRVKPEPAKAPAATAPPAKELAPA